MSLSLVKKSLELTTTEDRSADPRTVAKKNLNELKLKKKRLIDDKKNAAVVVQKIREKISAEEKVDKVELNVQRLLSLSNSNTIHKKLESKLIDRVGKKKKESKKPEKEETTGFTEEDFIKFEKEYFAN